MARSAIGWADGPWYNNKVLSASVSWIAVRDGHLQPR
jgi:hypothetical protein